MKDPTAAGTLGIMIGYLFNELKPALGFYFGMTNDASTQTQTQTITHSSRYRRGASRRPWIRPAVQARLRRADGGRPLSCGQFIHDRTLHDPHVVQLATTVGMPRAEIHTMC